MPGCVVTKMILLDTIAKVRGFVDITFKSKVEIDLKRGRYVVDGKSIMGIFSLDTDKPIKMQVCGEVEDVNLLLEQLEPFFIKE